MKFLLVICAALLSQSVEAQTVMSYNIRNCMGLAADSMNVERVASVIRRERPTVVAVQEVDSCTGRSAGRDVLSELAAATGMNGTYSAAIDYSGGRYGIGVLSDVAPLSVRRFALPGREEQRTLLIAEFAQFVFFATHLSLTGEDSFRSMEIIDSLATSYDKRVILAGDLNFTPADPQYRILDEKFQILSVDAPSYPADTPTDRIDYIALYKKDGHKDIKLRSHYVVDAPTQSDHRPLVVLLGRK